MRIYTKAGDLAFKTFAFPDGQPHFKLETYETDFRDVTIEAAIKSPTDLFTILLASDVLRQHGYSVVALDVRYLTGARMDRAIDACSPFTLATVARLINGAGFNRVRILDVHSEVATRLIRNSENILPHDIVRQVVTTLGSVDIVIPDKGAIARCLELANYVGTDVVYCKKHRDMSTGALTSFSVDGPWDLMRNDRPKLIVDDICDGGGTFVGLAKELRKAGAKKVFLFVTHGIFSKGFPLEGIDKIFTTDSYETYPQLGSLGVQDVVVIPISMKEL